MYLDLNASGSPDAGEPGLAGRVVFLDLNHDGTLDAGDPTATTDANGDFTLTSSRRAPSGDRSHRPGRHDRYVVDQTGTNADGTVAIGVVPISPVAPVQVVPSPFSTSPSTDANTAYVQSLYHAVLGRTGADAEVNAWLVKLNAGMTRQEVALGFVNSPEHRRTRSTPITRSSSTGPPTRSRSTGSTSCCPGSPRSRSWKGSSTRPSIRRPTRTRPCSSTTSTSTSWVGRRIGGRGRLAGGSGVGHQPAVDRGRLRRVARGGRPDGGQLLHGVPAPSARAGDLGDLGQHAGAPMDRPPSWPRASWPAPSSTRTRRPRRSEAGEVGGGRENRGKVLAFREPDALTRGRPRLAPPSTIPDPPP